jgi:hypothetical protein
MTDSSLLIQAIEHVRDCVTLYRDHARQFYFEVVLSIHRCQGCGAKMRMTDQPSRCECECGAALDPTIAFQRSHCCQAKLRLARNHYVCTNCGATVPSHFLFDEKLFAAQYMREKMSESRERKRRRREEIRLLLAASRSSDLCITDFPTADALGQLSTVLDRFVGQEAVAGVAEFIGNDEFSMEDYRQAILSRLGGCSTRFDAFPAMCSDRRLDQVRRFMTLLFMEQAREVRLEQQGSTIMVMKL